MKELCFNLWYYLDIEQNITAIAAKTYLLEGSDDDKASALLSASREDYGLVPPSEIEPMNYSLLQRLGVETVFSSVFERIERDLPTNSVLPDEKCFYATPLFDFGEGFVPAIIGDGFITERG